MQTWNQAADEKWNETKECVGQKKEDMKQGLEHANQKTDEALHDTKDKLFELTQKTKELFIAKKDDEQWCAEEYMKITEAIW